MSVNKKIDLLLNKNSNNIDEKLKEAAKERLLLLINKRTIVPYASTFTNKEKKIIYNLVTKILVELTYC